MRTLNSIYYSVIALGLLTTLTAGVALDVITTDMHRQLLSAGENYELSYLSERLIYEIGQSNRYDSLWILTLDRSYLETRDRWRSEVNQLFYQIQAIETDPRDLQLLGNAVSTVQGLFSSQDQEGATPGVLPSPALLRQRATMTDQAYTPLRNYVDSKRTKATEITARSKAAERLSDWIARCSEAVALVFFLCMIWLLRAALNRPLKRLFSAMEQYRLGKTDVRIPVDKPAFGEALSASIGFNQLADSIRDLESRKMEYLVGVAHDIRNPLTAMKTAAVLLRQQAPLISPEKTRELLDIVAAQTDRLDELVGDWMDVERISQGRLEVKLGQVDIRELVKDAIRLWTTASRGHWLTLLAPHEPVFVETDARRLSQVLNNLISNAIKYSPNGGGIDISVLRGDSSVVISVADHGIGISEEDIPHIFEPFKRSIAVRELIPGIGLGLSTSKKIVETLGGTIQVESKLGMGSIFKLIFPKKIATRQAA